MRLYEATLMEKPFYGERRPVVIDGHEFTREVTAKNHSKARYSFLLDLQDAWGDEITFSDIRVRSLAKREPRFIHPGWEQRVENVNAIIRVIGSHGRRFLSANSDRRDPVDNPTFAYFSVDARNEIWYCDRYSRALILVRLRDWPGFSDGGTLRSLVQHFADYIWGKGTINMDRFGPWPEWLCNGDLWGYGESMQAVRDEIAKLVAGSQATREKGK